MPLQTNRHPAIAFLEVVIEMGQMPIAMQGEHASRGPSSSSISSRKTMRFPASCSEVLLGFVELLGAQMSLLQKEKVVSFGPDPVLNASAKEGHVPKDEAQGLVVMLGPLGLTGFQSFNGICHKLTLVVMNQPELDNLLPLLIRNVGHGDRILVIISKPVGVVHGMDAHIVPVLMPFSLMQNQADNPVSGHMNMNSILREGNVDAGGEIQRPVMLGPLPLYQSRPLKVQDEAIGSPIKVLPSFFVSPQVDKLIQGDGRVSRWEQHVEGNLFSVLKPSVKVNMEKLATEEGAVRKIPQEACKIPNIRLSTFLEVLENMVHLIQIAQQGWLVGPQKLPNRTMCPAPGNGLVFSMSPCPAPASQDRIGKTHVVRVGEDAGQSLSHNIDVSGKMWNITLNRKELVECVFHPSQIKQKLTVDVIVHEIHQKSSKLGLWGPVNCSTPRGLR